MLPMISLYNPIRHVERVKVPILFIGATQETVCPYEHTVKASTMNPLAELVSVNTTHFQVYLPSPARDQVTKAVTDFLKKLT